MNNDIKFYDLYIKFLVKTSTLYVHNKSSYKYIIIGTLTSYLTKYILIYSFILIIKLIWKYFTDFSRNIKYVLF